MNPMAPSRRITRAYSQVPVTALAFFQSASGPRYILVGEDTLLKVYEEHSSHAIGQLQVFKAQPIHGIFVQQQAKPGRIVVWGAAEVAFLTPRAIDGLVGGNRIASPLLKPTKALDWIYDAAVSPFDAGVAVLATAHNEIVQVAVDDETGAVSFGDVISPSRPILYSANLRWTSPDCVIVAGGTVFGEILVWKCHLNRQAEERHEMLFVLTGHEGSIFGVHLSEEISLPDGTSLRLLASCSDDRTVRVWDVTERTASGERQEHQLDAPRETGFGSSPGQDSTSKETNKPVAMAMGHASRIWGVKLMTPTGKLSLGEPLPLYSFGEDSTTQRWHLVLNETVPEASVTGSLKHQQTFTLHTGKHLWSHAIQHEGGKTAIVTGGADSKVSFIEEPSASPTSTDARPLAAHDLIVFSLQDILPSLPAQAKAPIFSRYDFISETDILATTSSGNLLLGKFSPELQWHQVDVDESVLADLKTCYVLRGIGHGGALLGGTSGNIYHFCEQNGLSLIATVPGKIVEIFCLSRYPAKNDEQSSVGILVHMYGVSDAHYFSLDGRTGAVQDRSEVKGLDSRFAAISAAIISPDLLAIGSRRGWLSLLRKGEDGYRPVLDLAPRTLDAITSIVPLPPSVNGHSTLYILTTSRDGKYRIYEVCDGESGVRLDLRHETSPPFGPMIEGAWFTDDAAPELVLYGFKSKNFVVWNETRREEIASVDCGGAHRTFTLGRNPSNPYQLRFAFTKASKLSIFSKRQAAHRAIKQGTHGREVRAISSNGKFIATGAEDTSIRIWEYQEKPETELRYLASMKHVTGLQQLKWVGDDYLLSSAGFEELFVWRLRKLDTSHAGLAVVCEAVFDDKTTDGDLRIMDFDVHRAESSFVITMVMSNSALRTYRYTAGMGFQLLARTAYTGACLTQVRHLAVDKNGASVLTASTDGHLATWVVRLNPETVGSHQMVQALPVHQSSIKSLDMQASGDGYLVLTGGDDNSLGVSSIIPSLREAGTYGYTVSGRGIVRKAHAAAINGVAMMGQGNGVMGVSVSNDQRIKTWRIGDGSMQLVADEYSGVADPGDIEVLREGAAKVMVGGVGIEVWDV